MSSVVAVNHQYLLNMAKSSRQIAAALDGFLRLPGDGLANSPEVDRAYRDMSYDWDKRRGELADALEAIADCLTTTSQSFDKTDQELADALQGNGPPAN